MDQRAGTGRRPRRTGEPRRGAAAGDGDAAVVSTGAGARRTADLFRAVRLLPRPRRDGRRNRARSHARRERRGRCARRHARPARAQRPRRQGHAGLQSRRGRPRGRRRLHSRPEDEGGVVDRRTPRRGPRGSPDRQRRGREEVFRRRVLEVPFADRRLRRPRETAGGAHAAAAHALPHAAPARRRARRSPSRGRPARRSPGRWPTATSSRSR